MDEQPKNVELATVLRVIRRRGPIVLVCLVLTGAAAYAISKHQPKQYTASSSILFENTQLQQQAAGLPGTAVQNPQAEIDTNIKLVTLPRIASATAAAIGNGISPGAVSGAVTVAEQGDTNLATISATAGAPSLAARIANEYARQAILYRQQADRAYYANSLRAVTLEYKALTPVEKRGPQGTDLKDRAESLQILSQLQGSTVQFAQAAGIPTGPSSPNTRRNTALGLLLGLIIGLAFAVGLERFDRRLREPSDLEAAYGLPLIGVVPESAALRVTRSKAHVAAPLPRKEAEIFGLLRAHLRYSSVDRDLQLLLVISAAPGDGKSTVARNLAFSAASAGERVLFIEADLRRPTAASDFGVAHSPGIAEVLIENLALEDAVQRVEAGTGASSVSLDVLVAGGILPPNPAQVIESHAMRSLLKHARALYDFVIIDTPPLALLSDAFSLLKTVDGVLVVSRLGHNRRDVAVRLKATLDTANAPTIGVIANGFKERRSTSYGYGYGYGSYLDGREVSTVTPSANGSESEGGAAPDRVGGGEGTKAEHASEAEVVTARADAGESDSKTGSAADAQHET